MKTKMKLHLIIYIAIASFLVACENEIPYNPGKQKTQLIMNALLDAEQAENYVFLHLGAGYSIERVNEATLSLYVNDKLVESPEAISPEELYGDLKGQLDKDGYEVLLKSIQFKKYRLTTVLHPGDNIRLEATAENGRYHASAEVTVPQPIESLQVDTSFAYLREYSGQTLYRQYEITLQDRPNEKNYYRLEILNNYHIQARHTVPSLDEEGNQVTDEYGTPLYVYKDTTFNYSDCELINREDIILTDGNISHSDEDEDNVLFPIIHNKYNIFTDNSFPNSFATLKVYMPLIPKGLNWYYDVRASLLSSTVRLLSITETEYRYLKALNCLDDGDYDEALMEPVSLPCNVEGGLGFVGAAADARIKMEFPEVQRRNWNDN